MYCIKFILKGINYDYISEGSVSHINDVWPSFLIYIRDSQLIISIVIYGIKSHALLCHVRWEWSDKYINTQSDPDTLAFFSNSIEGV